MSSELITPPEWKVTDIIKSVFCSYRGILIVYSFRGKVNELSGVFTLEKAERIEELSNKDTEFDGRDLYDQFISEALSEKQKKDKENQQTQVLNQQESNQVSSFTIENTSKKTLPVVLFGARESIIATNFGNDNGIIIDKPNDYSQFLAQSIASPVIIKTMVIQNINFIYGVMEIKKKTSNGFTSSSRLNFMGGNPLGIQQNISQRQLNLMLDGNTEFNFDLAGNSKINIQLIYN